MKKTSTFATIITSKDEAQPLRQKTLGKSEPKNLHEILVDRTDSPSTQKDLLAIQNQGPVEPNHSGDDETESEHDDEDGGFEEIPGQK